MKRRLKILRKSEFKRNFDLIMTINDNVKWSSRITRKAIRELASMMTGRRYYCAALSGESSYNICINSDMTVSCNCRDYDGSGHIGDLETQTFPEIFSSETAQRFRATLAKGRLPILTCASCPELKPVTAIAAVDHRDHYRLPALGIMVENSISCNYQCAGCSRETVVQSRRKKFMTLNDIRVVANLLKENHIGQVCYFNLGEPFIASGIYSQLKIIRQENPEINIIVSTNGSLLNNDEKRNAALFCDEILFSIDGVDDKTLSHYQRGGVFAKTYNNMKQLADFRDKKGLQKPVIEWKYVLFNWNDNPDMIIRAIKLAKEAKVDIISFWPTRVPLYGISWRYIVTHFYKTLGEKSWKGRELRIR